MTPSREAIEAVRRQWPAWDDWTIARHLKQRAELSRIATEQRERRGFASVSELSEAVDAALATRRFQP